ncbi:MAG: sugar ABC transporter ATP-binding protein [Meiothermus silvanus]|nr:sugar ABC transporter ATP-binding protein [Allomeiothermus silvanus]
MEGIYKRFGGVQALKGVNFDLRQGEVHALVGENGAGKSTLIKILSGAYQPDAGTVRLEGRTVAIADPRLARALGIATIYQETSLYPDLSVLENLFIGHQPRRGWGRLDWAAMQRRAREVFVQLGVELPLTARLGDLGKAYAQLVEIAKALVQKARILVMDEATAALTADDVERLFGIIRGLREQGVAIIYISHRLEEVFRVADRVTVLRDGERVGSEPVAAVDQDWLIQRMVGRELHTLYPRNYRSPGKVLLEVRGLSRAGAFAGIDLEVHEGEIVGLAGLVGSGRSEVVRAIFGIDPYDAGTVRLLGESLPQRPWAAVRKGLALLPEDRSRQGVILAMTVRANMTLAVLRDLQRGGFLDEAKELSITERFIQALQLRPPHPDLPVASLSGGNQQKVVLGKWLATEPRVLILDEPTQGVDVGAKAEIHQLMDRLVGQGMGILMISSDLPEVLGMADRLLVMHRGKIVARLPRGSAPDVVMRAATGLLEEAHVR